jgi:2-haloacid dehalogenase
MVNDALRAADLSPAPTPEQVYTADDAKCYKPGAEIYRALLRQLGRDARPQDVFLVSSNPFDVVGARAVGMRALWVDRAGTGWTDALGAGLGPGGRELAPTEIVRGLGDIAAYVRTLPNA